MMEHLDKGTRFSILNEEQMDTSPAQKAISLALQGSWKEAIEANKKILAENPADIDSLNRMARAYSELGDISQARKCAEQVIKIDPINTIAVKSLEKWKKLTKVEKAQDITAQPDSFLEEPGRTKLISLLHTGDETIFASLTPGEEVKLVPSAHRLSVMTGSGKYIGRLPDDLAARLNSLMKEGNKYLVLVKSIGHREIDVFVKELERGEKVKDINSFPPEKIDYVSFTPPELVHAEAPIEIGEDLEDAEGTAAEP